jgi:hypothetical protein
MTVAPYPHCDQRVLHAPDECVYCDAYPEAQQDRVTRGINFTGHSDLGKQPCPADAARGLGQAHRWGGNAPRPKANATCSRCGGPALRLFSSLECLSMFCLPKEPS